MLLNAAPSLLESDIFRVRRVPGLGIYPCHPDGAGIRAGIRAGRRSLAVRQLV